MKRQGAKDWKKNNQLTIVKNCPVGMLRDFIIVKNIKKVIYENSNSLSFFDIEAFKISGFFNKFSLWLLVQIYST